LVSTLDYGHGHGGGIGTSIRPWGSVRTGVFDWLAKAVPVESKSAINIVNVKIFLVIGLEFSSVIYWPKEFHL
jgi:hypothetical protein